MRTPVGYTSSYYFPGKIFCVKRPQLSDTTINITITSSSCPGVVGSWLRVESLNTIDLTVCWFRDKIFVILPEYMGRASTFSHVIWLNVHGHKYDSSRIIKMTSDILDNILMWWNVNTKTYNELIINNELAKICYGKFPITNASHIALLICPVPLF